MLKNLMNRFKRSEKGQGLVEYGLILALISLMGIGALTGVGGTVNDTFDKVTGDIGVIEESEAEDDIFLASDHDFEWVPYSYAYGDPYLATNEEGKGYYKYVGSNKVVKVPHAIKGHQMTNYFKMFIKTDVEKVISDNPNITCMSWMFNESKATDLDLSELDTQPVTNMKAMLYDSKVESVDIANFDTSNVENISYMFRGTEKLTDLDLSGIDTSKVTTMTGTFSGTPAKIKGLENLDTSSVVSMKGTFAAYKGKEVDISGWDTENVKDMSLIFSNGHGRPVLAERAYAYGFSHPGVVSGTSRLESVDFGNKWTTKNVEKMDYIFRGGKVKDVDLMYKGWDLSNLTSLRGMFYTGNLSSDSINMKDYNINYDKVTDMTNLFAYSGAKSIDFGNTFDTSNVETMPGMFYNSRATSVNGIDKFNTSKVTNMHSMFANSYLAELNLRGFDTSSVTDMHGMFHESKAVNLYLSNFDTRLVTDMEDMFFRSNVTSLDLSSFDTGSVTKMGYMFSGLNISTGYARTQVDADKFNSSTDKPSRLTFTVK